MTKKSSPKAQGSIIPFGRNFRVDTARDRNIIGKKILEARKKCQISQSAFVEKLAAYGVNVQVAAISKWENGETIPNAYQLLAVCLALGITDGLSYFIGRVPESLIDLNAEGLRKLEAYKNDLIASGLYQIRRESPVIAMRDMPWSTLPASAGLGEFLDGNNMEMRSFPVSSIPAGADFAVSVNGDSMEPVYTNGQTVWVQQCETLNPGDVGLFVVDDEGFIKIYDEREPDGDDLSAYLDSYGVLHPQVVLISYNEAYKPRVIRPTMGFKIVGRILN